MRKFVLIPDSFKGTLSSMDICDIMREEIGRVYPEAEVLSVPVADGGEGSVDCFLCALGGERIEMTVRGPRFEALTGFYGLLPDGTAVVEMAAAAGLPLIKEKNPAAATTYGVGELILAAAKRGARRILVGLGGSSTNDGGCGAAAAAGVKFYNAAGEVFVPTGGNLCEIASICMKERDPALEGIEIVAMCDVDNPMHGPQGAAHIFGPQKGADEAMVRFLDEGLVHLDEILRRDLGQNLGQAPGAGSAGAMGAGMMAFFGARLQMGINAVLDTVDFENLVRGADMILTGEGKIDGQSLRGKVVIGVARRAKPTGIPVVAIVGTVADDADAAYAEGVSAIFSTNRAGLPFEQLKPRAKSDLARTVYNLMHFIKSI